MPDELLLCSPNQLADNFPKGSQTKLNFSNNHLTKTCKSYVGVSVIELLFKHKNKNFHLC